MNTDADVKVNRAQIYKFLLLSFFLGWTFQIISAYQGGRAGNGSIWATLGMWTPALAAMLAGSYPRRLSLDSLKKTGWRYWGLALIFGWLPTLLSSLLIYIFRLGSLNAEKFSYSSETYKITITGLGTILGNGPQSVPIFVLNYFISITVAAIVFAPILGVGEELGWRGVLQPSLERENKNFFKTCIIVGVIWAAWHIPINLLDSDNSSNSTLVTFFFFPFFVIGHAIAYAWLARESGSVWPAAIAHMSHNTIQSGPLMRANSWVVDEFAGLVGMAITVGLVFFLYRRKIKKDQLQCP